MHYGKASQLHEQNDQEAVVYDRKTDNIAANEVSVAIAVHRWLNKVLTDCILL